MVELRNREDDGGIAANENGGTVQRPASTSFPPVHYDRGSSLHSALERTADRVPEHIAIRFGDDGYSFRDLDGLSSAFARVLLERGVQTGTRVAIMASNRPEFAIALFAVLKFGVLTRHHEPGMEGE